MAGRWPRILLLTGELVAVCLIGRWLFTVMAWRAEVRESARLLEAGRYDAARDILARLSSRWPGAGDIDYRLGIVERELGHHAAALAAWSRIPKDSPWAARALLPMARLVIERGEFSKAEALLSTALNGPDADEARQTLARLLLWEGRRTEMRRLMEAGCERSPDRASALRELWIDDTQIYLPVDAIEAAVARSDDDRAWLARAHLAMLAGRFDEADRWLDACLRLRPGDEAVWGCRLEASLAAGRPATAAAALTHLSASRFNQAEVLALQAWFAQQRGDAALEQSILKQLVEWDPGHAKALERLAALALSTGHAAEAERFRARKAVVDRACGRYRALLAPRRPVPSAELARLAETLGRYFESRGWWRLLAARTPSDSEVINALARLNRFPAEPAVPAQQTLADRVGDVARGAFRCARAPKVALATPARFRDDAEAAGLRFAYENGRSPLRQLPETMGGGVAVFDYDGDGWLDVYAVQGGRFPPREPPGPCADRLFRNRGDRTFEDATNRSGLASMSGGYGLGAAVGDFDGDGHPDLFVTRWRSYALYRNRGDGTFEDVTERVGFGGERDWPMSAAWADFDNDGDLDLYVCHYCGWDAGAPLLCRASGQADRNTYCDPRKLVARPDHLFRNDHGVFTDVTLEAGVVDPDGRGLGVLAADLDGDRRVDVFVANDTTANYFFRNAGAMRFAEVGLSAGVAGNASGGFQAGMGVTCGDLNSDGLLDLVVTNFYNESTTYYENLGKGMFTDRSTAVGLAGPTRFLLGFGTAVLDYDNDGFPDLATANGHVNDERPFVPYAMPTQLLAGGPGGRLSLAPSLNGANWTVPRVGRGLAAGDLDNDGRIDLLVVAQDAPLAYFRNQTAGGGFITFRLQGTASNRDAVGAVVTVTAGGRRQVAQRVGGGSYLSASDSRIHFGLGTARRVDSVEVVWPSGRISRYRDLAADTGYLLVEGDAPPRPLDGFAGESLRARVR